MARTKWELVQGSVQTGDACEDIAVRINEAGNTELAYCMGGGVSIVELSGAVKVIDMGNNADAVEKVLAQAGDCEVAVLISIDGESYGFAITGTDGCYQQGSAEKVRILGYNSFDVDQFDELAEEYEGLFDVMGLDVYLEG